MVPQYSWPMTVPGLRRVVHVGVHVRPANGAEPHPDEHLPGARLEGVGISATTRRRLPLYTAAFMVTQRVASTPPGVKREYRLSLGQYPLLTHHS